MSTRVDGAEPPVIVITAKATLAAGAACRPTDHDPTLLDELPAAPSSPGRRTRAHQAGPTGRVRHPGPLHQVTIWASLTEAPRTVAALTSPPELYEFNLCRTIPVSRRRCEFAATPLIRSTICGVRGR